MSFRNKEAPPSTQKNSEGINRSVDASPIRVDYAASSGRTPMAHIQFGSPSQPFQSINTGGLSSSIPVQQHAQSTAAAVLPGTVRSVVHGHPHPNAIRTIVQTAVPIINPVIIQSAVDSKEEIESLEQQRNLILDQYDKLYQMYEDLKNKPREPRPKPFRESTPPKTEPVRPTTISSHGIAVMQSQLNTQFSDF